MQMLITVVLWEMHYPGPKLDLIFIMLGTAYFRFAQPWDIFLWERKIPHTIRTDTLWQHNVNPNHWLLGGNMRPLENNALQKIFLSSYKNMLALQFCEMNPGNVYFWRTKESWPITARNLLKTKSVGRCLRAVWPGCCWVGWGGCWEEALWAGHSAVPVWVLIELPPVGLCLGTDVGMIGTVWAGRAPQTLFAYCLALWLGHALWMGGLEG